jgi:hypothetical protein
MVFSSLKHLSARYRAEGIDSLLYSLSWRMPRWLFRYSHVYLVAAQDLDVVKPGTDAFDFRLAQLSDASSFALLGLSPETVGDRLTSGDLCGAAMRRDGMLCSMVWVSTGRLHLDAAGIILDTDLEGVNFYNAFTLPELRGHGLNRGCSSVYCDWFRRQGRTVRYALIDRLNDTSIVAHGRMNLKPTGESRHFHVLFFEITRLANWPKTGKRLMCSIWKRTHGARVV